MNKSYNECLVITALLESSLTEIQVMLLAKNIFNWPLEETRQRFREISSNCCLAEGTLCVRAGDDVCVETGDRVAYIDENFLAQCSLEHAAALRKARDELMSRR